MRRLRRPDAWVFAILLASYGFFWQARDWNSASRLMLTYALVDRGTVAIDGLEKQTGDKAADRGHYYSDKLPGFSVLATFPYALAKLALRLPNHPLRGETLRYWPADYWITLGTAGLCSALAGALLARLAEELGCGPRRALLVGLSYGLATPALAYATMSYGHQVTAFALLAAFGLLWRVRPGRDRLRVFTAGVLAAYAAVVELQVGPVSAILGFYLLAQVAGRLRPPSVLGEFAVGALLPTLLLLGYNIAAFGSPFDMGYFHHAFPEFRDVHSSDNPLGLGSPSLGRAAALLWGGYRGLLFYAPILGLSVPGWVVLLRRGLWGMAIVSFAVVAAVFAVNMSYPEWTGGWSTGPRLLVPMLPFAMLPVAALMASGNRTGYVLALVLATAGGILMLLFEGAGARIPSDVGDPLRQVVWPVWRGDPLPPPPLWVSRDRFTRDVVSVAFPAAVSRLPDRLKWLQFVPLVAFQALAVGLFLRLSRAPRAVDERTAADSPLRENGT